MTPSGSITLDDVHYDYPDGHPVLRGVSLDIRPGERVAILGRNGAGKTTLLLHLNGILTPTRGVVSINGRPITKDSLREVRRSVGIVFQDPDDQLFMPTVGEDVAFGPQNFGISEPELSDRVRLALHAVGLPHVIDHAPHHLSLGQRRRAAIATILATHSDIVVLDEPTSNLDPPSRRELSHTLTDLSSTLVVVTHDLPYAHEICTRAVILDEGKIVADGPTHDIMTDTSLLASHGLELPYGFLPHAH